MIRCGQLDDTYTTKKRGKANTEMVEKSGLEAYLRVNVKKDDCTFVDQGGKTVNPDIIY